MAVNQAK